MLGAAHDAGTAIGAALDIAREKDGALPESRWLAPRVLTPFLGPWYDDSAIEAAIARWGRRAEKVQDPARMAASLLADGQIVGWFQGRMEFGPRALGGRSLLADPRRPGSAMRSIGGSSTASPSGPSARPFWPKMRLTGSRSRAIGRGPFRAGT